MRYLSFLLPHHVSYGISHVFEKIQVLCRVCIIIICNIAAKSIAYEMQRDVCENHRNHYDDEELQDIVIRCRIVVKFSCCSSYYP